MTLDPVRLQYALFLATGEMISPNEADKLAKLLGVRDEVLPYALLRREGFRSRPEILEAISAARGPSAGRISTPRAPQRANAVRLKAAEAELADAIRSMIEMDLDASEEHARFDEARRALTNQLPSQPGEYAHTRILR